MQTARTTLLILDVGDLHQGLGIVYDGFRMAGALYLPWMVGVLMKCPGEGYWLSFAQRLPISYDLGDEIFGLLHPGHVPKDNEDTEGEVVEDTVEEEVL